MPAPEYGNGRAYIWIIACILFICIVAGGSCLGAYVLLPENQVTSWLPVAGVVFVCLPWAFWVLTFIYRIISRAFGFRVRFGGGGGGDGGGKAGNVRNCSPNEDVEGASDHANGKGDVQFGEAGAAAAGGGLQRTSSVGSNESEMPLAKSMHSS